MTEPVRLAKRLAEMIPCSRREAEQYIEGGWVTVDGQTMQEPQFRVSQQRIELNPDATLGPIELVTILLHRTAGDTNVAPEITVANHAADDVSGIRPLKRHFSRLAATLPLEPDASGLMVLTQDWRVVRKLVDDAVTVEQEYIVEVDGELSTNGLKQLNLGFSFNGRAMSAAKVSWQSEKRLRFALKGAQPGQIAQMCLGAGLQVRSMKRLRIGKISMAKLQAGQWRYLPPNVRF